MSDKHQETKLKDYAVPNYLIKTVDLKFELDPEKTIVTNTMEIRKNPQSQEDGNHLELNGKELVLLAVQIDGESIDEKRYQVSESSLYISSLPNSCTLTIITQISPSKNTTLSGLYCSNDMFCTQCEATGFRRITYYLDRPDVLAVFTTTIIAEKNLYPILLSNGNPVASGELVNNRHWVKWADPYPKPAYLFALVAGNLCCISDEYETLSGKKVDIRFYVEHENKNKCGFAIQSLKNAMRWDEETYKREYDLDIYMVVAVSDFNMGAMENKGLNIFNSKYVLIEPKLATDTDYIHVEAVVGHEYFHNWTGNRITLRDWFQLSLKEGLTVFREQSFSQAMGLKTAKRIDDVNLLRTKQFEEDASPLSHSVRPDSYIEINNFYTLTVYEKGAEVIRVLYNFIGSEAYFKGMEVYFTRHDGDATTIEDFLKCFEDANDISLLQFKLWYLQKGTPLVTVTSSYDSANKKYTLEFTQTNNQQDNYQPLPIPTKIALFSKEGTQLGPEKTYLLTKQTQQIEFSQISEEPIPSMFRDFTAPVKINYPYSEQALSTLLAYDTDEFNRYDSACELYSRAIINLMADPQSSISHDFLTSYKKLLNSDINNGLKARAMVLPDYGFIMSKLDVVLVDKLVKARAKLNKIIKDNMVDDFYILYDKLTASVNDLSEDGFANRALKNSLLSMLVKENDTKSLELANRQYLTADTMTEKLYALQVLCNFESNYRTQALASFYEEYSSNPLMIDKWFAVQAQAEHPHTIDRIKFLRQHEAFKLSNPNRVYSLLLTFASKNFKYFHSQSGEGYDILATDIINLNQTNPQVAARLCQPLLSWRKFSLPSASNMQKALEKIKDCGELSANVYEMVQKALQ